MCCFIDGDVRWKKGILFFIRFLSNRERIGEEIKIKSFSAEKGEGGWQRFYYCGGRRGVRGDTMVISNYWLGKHNNVGRFIEKSNHVVVVSFCAHHNIHHPKSNRPLIPREGFKWEIIYSVWFSGVCCMCVSWCVCKFV